MKRIIHEFWTGPGTLLTIGLLFAALVFILAAILEIQRRDYRRALDASAIRSLEQVRAEIQTLRVQDELSIRDREQIKRDVESVKKAVTE